MWDSSLLFAFTVDPTGNGEHLRSEAGSRPLRKTACQGHCPCLHPFCPLLMSPAAPTRNANTQRPSGRLQFSSHCARVPSFRWPRQQAAFTHLLGWLVKRMQGCCWTERLPGISCKGRFKMGASSYSHTPGHGHLFHAWAGREPSKAVVTMVELHIWFLFSCFT